MTFRLCPFHGLIKSISGCNIAHIRAWNGQYRRLKRCISHHEKISIGCKLLVYSRLHKALIFREFAFEGESARKYSLIFRGRTENSDGKTATCLQSESAPVCLIRTEIQRTYTELKTQAFIRYLSTLIFYRANTPEQSAKNESLFIKDMQTKGFL